MVDSEKEKSGSKIIDKFLLAHNLSKHIKFFLNNIDSQITSANYSHEIVWLDLDIVLPVRERFPHLENYVAPIEMVSKRIGLLCVDDSIRAIKFMLRGLLPKLLEEIEKHRKEAERIWEVRRERYNKIENDQRKAER